MPCAKRMTRCGWRSRSHGNRGSNPAKLPRMRKARSRNTDWSLTPDQRSLLRKLRGVAARIRLRSIGDIQFRGENIRLQHARPVHSRRDAKLLAITAHKVTRLLI